MVDSKADDAGAASGRPRPRKPKARKPGGFKELECRVICYDSRTQDLDVDFRGYGIRIKGAPGFSGASRTATVKYRGEIGKPGFEYGL